MATGKTNAASGVALWLEFDDTAEGAFRSTNITSFKSDLVVAFKKNCFNNCLDLREVWAPLAVTTGVNVFSNCASLKSVYMKGNDNYGILSGTFNGCSALEKVALAHTNVVALATTLNTTIPRNTLPIKFYVPSNLISSYQTATNWSTLYNNGYITFANIDNYWTE